MGLVVARVLVHVATPPFLDCADTDPPVLQSGFPKMVNVEDFSMQVQVKIDEPGTAYYVVLQDGAAAPSTDQIIAGTNSANAAAIASGSGTLSAYTTWTGTINSGLTADTPFDVWVVAVDARDPVNKQSAGSKVDVTTGPDVTPPVFTYARTSAVGDYEVTLEAVTDESGTVYWIVQGDTVAVPSAAQIKAGQDGSGGGALVSGSWAAVGAVESSASLTKPDGLTPSTAYKAYFVAEVGGHRAWAR